MSADHNNQPNTSEPTISELYQLYKRRQIQRAPAWIEGMTNLHPYIPIPENRWPNNGSQCSWWVRGIIPAFASNQVTLRIFLTRVDDVWMIAYKADQPTNGSERRTLVCQHASVLDVSKGKTYPTQKEVHRRTPILLAITMEAGKSIRRIGRCMNVTILIRG